MKLAVFSRYPVLGFIFLLTSIAASAQEAAWPSARPEDVASVPGIVKASYDAISGPPGQILNLDRFRSLFLPTAQLVSVSVKGGQAEAHVMTLKQFVDMVTGMIGKDGHVEHELSERADVYGNMANVWSTYESRTTLEDAHVMRGINSIQLFNDGKRWWISGAQWQHESPDAPIPAKYLSAAR
jgi:hypothetical protein